MMTMTNRARRAIPIMLVFGFSSCALSLLDEAGLTSKADIDRIEAAVSRTMTTRRLMRMWNGLPAKVMGALP